MKTKLSRKEAGEKIDKFFSRKNFEPKEVKKIKRIAMKFNIKFGIYRKKFCKKCLSQLKGNTRIGRIYKSVECEKCGYRNKFKMQKTN